MNAYLTQTARQSALRPLHQGVALVRHALEFGLQPAQPFGLRRLLSRTSAGCLASLIHVCRLWALTPDRLGLEFLRVTLGAHFRLL